jgi:hypothetical protein
VLRASAASEKLGVPTASLTCEGFIRQAKSTSVGLGMPNLGLALVPGHTGVQTNDELRRNILGVTLDQVIANLTGQIETAADLDAEPRDGEVVFSGTLDEVIAHFYEQEWSDGLPFVPPTIDRVERFLRFTDRDRHEVIGVPLPDSRAATIWNVAVNGVMAGCRPEYMPILVALAEAMCDPDYGVEHSGNTPGADTVIILNGPIIKQLGFNYEQGAMRDGFQANTSIGRFWRLYLRNVAGFLPHQTDKGTYGNTWRVVVAENEDMLTKIGWDPLSADFGFAMGENALMIGRYTGGDVSSSVSGSTPETMLPYLAHTIANQARWQLMFTVGVGHGTYRPLLFLSPILAETIARAGWSKYDIKCYLFEHARITARQFEQYGRIWTNKPESNSIANQTRLGNAPAVFAESDDPERLVPVVCDPEDYQVVVTGDPLRTNAYSFAHNGHLGYTVGRRIELPAAWDSLLAALPPGRK